MELKEKSLLLQPNISLTEITSPSSSSSSSSIIGNCCATNKSDDLNILKQQPKNFNLNHKAFDFITSSNPFYIYLPDVDHPFNSSFFFTFQTYISRFCKPFLKVNRKFNSYLSNQKSKLFESNNKNADFFPKFILCFFYLWKKRFMCFHECSEEEFVNIVLLSLLLNILKCFIGILFVVLSAIIFQYIDPLLSKEAFPELLLYTFTTVTTIGLGTLVPTSENGMFFCIFYICFGVPIILVILNNFSEIFAEFYWIFISVIKGKKEIETKHPHQLPVLLTIFLVPGYSVIGSVLFAWLMPNLDYSDTFYFSFISITTIGLGDISPKPKTMLEAIIIIIYISFGIIIFSAFMGSLTLVFYRNLNNGQLFKSPRYIEIKINNRKLNVGELIEIVSIKLNATPRKSQEIIEKLDELIIDIANEELKQEPSFT